MNVFIYLQCTIPTRGEGEFDTGSFSVRVFSTDFQQGQEESVL